MRPNEPVTRKSLGSPKTQIDYSTLLEQLTHATAFDLFRLRTALDRMLDEPSRIAQVKQTIRMGDEVEYFDAEGNRSVRARVLRCNRTRVLVKNLDDDVMWKISYCSINTEGASTAIHERPTAGLGRNEVSVGDPIGFLDRDNQEHYGTIIRLNRKTVTVICDAEKTQWRVAYSYLFPVLDAEDTPGRANVVDALSFRPNSAPK